MYRGTTPTLIFKYKQDLEKMNIDEFYLTFKQNGEIKLEKVKDDITIKKNLVILNLTQEETLEFTKNDIIEIQGRIKSGDLAFATGIIRTNMQQILKEGVI